MNKNLRYSVIVGKIKEQGYLEAAFGCLKFICTKETLVSKDADMYVVNTPKGNLDNNDIFDSLTSADISIEIPQDYVCFWLESCDKFFNQFKTLLDDICEEQNYLDLFKYILGFGLIYTDFHAKLDAILLAKIMLTWNTAKFIEKEEYVIAIGCYLKDAPTQLKVLCTLIAITTFPNAIQFNGKYKTIQALIDDLA